jgi:raffinose/stachyose/melibiose transport system substrate-binding protein
MRKVSKLALIVLILGLATTGVLFAGSQREAAPAAAQPVSLNFWHWRTEDVAVYDDILAKFMAKNPTIKVVQTAHKNTDYNTILSAAMKGGNPPDIAMLRAYGGLETYAKPGYLEPLGDQIPEVKAFAPGAIQGVTSISDGKIYGVPYASQTLLIFYNKPMYQKVGLAEPETWAEFLANLDKMKKAGITPLANGGKDGWTLEVAHGVLCPAFYGANDFFNAVVAGKTTFQDERYRKSLEKLLELRPYVPDMFMAVSYTDMQANFLNELAGHFIGGVWEGGYFHGQNAGLQFDVFAGPVAKKGDTRYVSTYNDGSFGLSSASPHKLQGITFLKYMATKEVGQVFVDRLRVLSDVPGVTTTDPFLMKVQAMHKATTPYIHLVGFRYEQPTGSALIQSGLQGLMAGTLTSAEVVKQLQDGLATWYAPFKK